MSETDKDWDELITKYVYHKTEFGVIAAHCKELREVIVNHMEQGLVDHTQPLWNVIEKKPSDYEVSGE